MKSNENTKSDLIQTNPSKISVGGDGEGKKYRGQTKNYYKESKNENPKLTKTSQSQKIIEFQINWAKVRPQ